MFSNPIQPNIIWCIANTLKWTSTWYVAGSSLFILRSKCIFDTAHCCRMAHMTKRFVSLGFFYLGVFISDQRWSTTSWWSLHKLKDIHILQVYFSHPIYYLGPSFSLPPSRTSDPGSHSRLFPPPRHPTTVRVLHFYREKKSALSSLVDSRRIVPTHARRSQQLVHLYFCNEIHNLTTAWFAL